MLAMQVHAVELSIEVSPSFAWVYAAFRSIRLVKRPSYLSQIHIPVLMFSAGRERIVSNTAQREIAAMLPDARLVDIAEGAHELLLERDAVRHAVWAEIDHFLAAGKTR